MRTVAIAVLFLGSLALIAYVGLRLAATKNVLGDRGRALADRLGIEPIEAGDLVEMPDPELQRNPPGPLGPSKPGTVVIDGVPPGFENVDVPEGSEVPGLTAEEAAAVQQALRSDPRLRGREGYGARLDADQTFLDRPAGKDGDEGVGGRRRGSCKLKRKLESQLRAGAARRMAPANR